MDHRLPDDYDAHRHCPALKLRPHDKAKRLPAVGGCCWLLIEAAAAKTAPAEVLAPPEDLKGRRLDFERMLKTAGNTPDNLEPALARYFGAPRALADNAARARGWLYDALVQGRLQVHRHPKPIPRPTRPPGRYVPKHVPTEEQWHAQQLAREAREHSAALREAGRALREAPEPVPEQHARPAPPEPPRLDPNETADDVARRFTEDDIANLRLVFGRMMRERPAFATSMQKWLAERQARGAEVEDARETHPAPAREEPADLDEAETRLQAARERLDARERQGLPAYEPKYSDAQLAALCDSGDVANARFLVSVQPRSTNPDAKLAFQRDSGLAPIWATSFDMLENADTDPELISQVLGWSAQYDPGKEYVMHIVDRGEDLTMFGQETIMPTWDNITPVSVKYLQEDFSEDTIQAIMTPEYQEQYAARMEVFFDGGGKEFDDYHIGKFAGRMAPAEKQQFEARQAIRLELGANNEFTGNGMTASTAPGGNHHGVVETLTLETDPPMIRELQARGCVKTVDLKPRTGKSLA
ncbi:MAG: hypothetical protein WED00_18485 [Aquisalimonadaceae bacterium]